MTKRQSQLKLEKNKFHSGERTKGIRKRCEDCGDKWQYRPGEKKCVLCGGELEKIAKWSNSTTSTV